MKGQSAIEYLMTYGWAILVILIVGVLLWQMGVFDVRNTTPGSRGFSQIRPLDWALGRGGSDNLKVVITNEAGTLLRVDNVLGNLISGGSGDCSNPRLSEGSFPIMQFRPGQSIQVTMTCSGVSGNPGDYYQANVTIDYYNPSSTLDHISTGIVWGALE